MKMSTEQFAAASYAFLLGIKAKWGDDKEVAGAIQDMLDTAPDSVKTSGRSVFGQIVERGHGL